MNFQPDAAETDYLTGLPNRRGLYDYYATLPDNYHVHAMFLDVDNFKRVNDIYGHSNGDELLVMISNLIAQHSHDFTSRIGGDEYVVLLPATIPEGDVTYIASEMQNALHKMDFRKDILSLVSLSIGIVLDQPVTSSLDDILKKCDAAMYEAKYNGKGRLSVFHGDDQPDLSRSIEAEMEEALKTGQFQTYFQPKVNMLTSQIFGAEALSRWIHPVDGLRSPNTYIPIFEKNGFISQLDMFVFEDVCRFKQSWKGQKYEHLPISINMSRLHLFNEDFPQSLSEIADRYEIPHRELELEITEGIFIKDNRELIRMVGLLNDEGFPVSIDDFGSGFSALNLLKDIPVSTIKIDKEFLHTSSSNERGKKVIRNIICMCRDLKLDVVTEGIETKEQIDFILSCGCTIAQGFYYSRPIPEPDFCKFADDYLTNPRDYFNFRFNGDLMSADGSKEAVFHGDSLEFHPGIFKDTKCAHFPGGKLQYNTVQIPPDVLVNDSYTISMWIRPEHNIVWSSALFVKFETGFLSILPCSPDSHSDFRVRDYKEISGWYDLPALRLTENIWWNYAVTYNARTERATAFINGDVVFTYENVPANRYTKMIMVGGDIYQPSFEGDICEIMIYNECKDYNFVRELHHHYTEDPGFIAFIP